MSVLEPGEGWAVAPSVASQDARVDITHLYATHRLALVRMAVLLVDDMGTAEDVVQDAFTALHQRSRSLRDPHAALGYLRVSVLNGCRSTLRRRKVRRAHPDMEDPGVSPGADRNVLVAEEHRLVLAAMRTLPRRQQEVLLLRYWSNLSEAEIADALGIAVGTVKSASSRGLDRLEALLRDVR